MFLDGARLPDFQDAWHAHFASRAASATVSPDPDTAAINEARQTLSRAEQVDREAVAVRERAEELSRRFAVDGEGTSAPAPDPGSEPASSDEPAVTETASISPASDDGAPVPAEPVAATVDENAAPRTAVVEQSVADAAPADDAPVIENMAATTPAKPAKRHSAPLAMRAGLQPAIVEAGVASPLPGGLLRVDPAAPKPDPNPSMPTELRAFGWNSQP